MDRALCDAAGDPALRQSRGRSHGSHRRVAARRRPVERPGGAAAHRLAHADHRWGLSPFHYVPGYYSEIWRQLEGLGAVARAYLRQVLGADVGGKADLALQEAVHRPARGHVAGDLLHRAVHGHRLELRFEILQALLLHRHIFSHTRIDLARAGVANHFSGKSKFSSIDFSAAPAMAPLGPLLEHIA